jgi:hypothetical protein
MLLSRRMQLLELGAIKEVKNSILGQQKKYLEGILGISKTPAITGKDA